MGISGERKEKIWILLKGRCKRMSLWEMFQSEKLRCSPHRRTHKKSNKNQRASFCTCIKASYTLEAAVVIPLAAAYMVSLLFFFSILEIQCRVDEALLYAGRKTAVESSVIDSEATLFLSAEAYLLNALREDRLVEKYVKHGSFGIHLWGFELLNEMLVLHAEYTVKLPISFGEIGEIRLSSQNRFRKWTGDRTQEELGNYVYVTLYGEVYHKDLSCRSIHLTVQSCGIEKIDSLRGKSGQKYKECLRCTWKDDRKERVYYTDYGEWYHKDIGCVSIKRTIDKIPIEEIGGRRPCSFCYGQ